MASASDRIVDLYRRHAQAWAALRGTDLMERGWLDRFTSLLPPNPSVLDLGCGSGVPIGRHLVDKGACLTGVDASPELISIAREHVREADWIVADMRGLQLERRFHGILAWDSTFHLTPDDQREMFPVFQRHAVCAAALMFTSGPDYGDAIGEWEGEALYHASLSGDEYRSLLDRHGFDVVDHVVEDPDCGFRTVWLARKRADP
ncbi:class I SAM-dependent methyltransferase [Algihabitans albus]|uniref:class I SAM-dependent DNA methyltransferase n=1 Tax=Algihabitans albus TaxID=2164067 RepID=UPI0035D0AD92